MNIRNAHEQLQQEMAGYNSYAHENQNQVDKVGMMSKEELLQRSPRIVEKNLIGDAGIDEV